MEVDLTDGWLKRGLAIVIQQVLDYYAKHREQLRAGVEAYSEAQGQGFICWRFINGGR